MTSKLEIITSQWEEMENRLTDERVKTARAKKFHKLGFKTREVLENWQRWNVPQVNLKEAKKKIGGKEEENKDKFSQYSFQRAIVETVQEHL